MKQPPQALCHSRTEPACSHFMCLEVFRRESEKKSKARIRRRKRFRHFNGHTRTLRKGGHKKRPRVRRILLFLDMDTVGDLDEFLCALDGSRVFLPLLQQALYPLRRLLYRGGMEDRKLVTEGQAIQEFDHGLLGDTPRKARPCSF